MKQKPRAPKDPGELRHQAEELFARKGGGSLSGDGSLSEELQRAVHELQVHQIELELQNEELQRSRAEVEAGLARYTDLYEYAPVGYLTLDRGGTIRQVNLTGARLLGLERANLVEGRLGILLAAGSRPTFSAFLERVFEGEARESCEVALSREDSDPSILEFTGRSADEDRACRIAISDITARKHAEAALQESERRYRMLFKESRDAMMTLAPPTWNFTSGNGAAIAMFGARDEAELFSHPPWHYSPERQGDGRDSAEKAEEMINRALREGSHYFDWTHQRLSGELLFVTVLLTRMELGGEVMLQATVRDETEKRRLKAAAAQSDRLASMGMLAAGVAHEINNPLAYVLYNVESLARDLPKLAGAVKRVTAALRERVGDEAFQAIAGDGVPLLQPGWLDEAVDSARDAFNGTERIKHLTRGLGTFSRVEQSELGRVDLNQTIESAITMAKNEIKYRARLVKELGEVPPVWASEGKLAQVFLNLLINASHAIDEGDAENNRITIRSWTEGGEVCAEVSDTGQGIPPETFPHIFEPFFSTKAVGAGSGLGLAICRNIVTAFGGVIDVESRVGEGTRFRVRLPVKPDGAGEEAPPLSRRMEGRIRRFGGGSWWWTMSRLSERS